MPAGARRWSGRQKGWLARQRNSSLLVRARQLQALVRQRGLRTSGTALPTLELPAQDRTEEEIVKLTRQSLQPEQRRDLSPVTNLVHHDVDYDLPGRCAEERVHQRELLHHVPLRRWEGVDKVAKPLPALSAE